MYIDRKRIEKIFKEEIIPSFTRFVAENYFRVEEKQLRGELFTQIRRHLPDLTSNKTSYGISMSNIDRIVTTKTGEVIGIAFKTHSSVYRNNPHANVVNVFNEVISKVQLDISKACFTHTLDKCIKDINCL